jgi:hypothetical protein
VRVPGDERVNLQIIVTSNDGVAGEFVALVSGPSVFPATDEDSFSIVTPQDGPEVPLGVYVVNLGLPTNPLNPRVGISFGETFTQECASSSSSTLCEGDSVDLTGSTVTLEEETPIELTGNDVMLLLGIGGDSGRFEIEVASAADSSTGPYYLMIHSGVGGEEPMEDGESEEGESEEGSDG